MKKLLKGIKDWIKSTFTGSNGEASSKRQLLAFLILCLGIAFIKNVWHPVDKVPSEVLVNAVVTVICFLGGATVGDAVAQAFIKKDKNPDELI